MNRRIAAALVALSIVAGIGVGFALQRMNDTPAVADPGSSSTVTPSPSASTGSPSGEESALVAANRSERTGPSWSPADPTDANGDLLEAGHAVPGAFQPVTVGKPVSDAVATGFIEKVPAGETPCEAPGWTFYRWVGQLSGGLDIQVDPAGKVVSLGMSKGGFETPEGISIGNSYEALKATYGDRLMGPETGEYGQSNVYLRVEDSWLGFLFDEAPDTLTDASRIVFMEATQGNQPSLMRDGC